MATLGKTSGIEHGAKVELYGMVVYYIRKSSGMKVLDTFIYTSPKKLAHGVKFHKKKATYWITRGYVKGAEIETLEIHNNQWTSTGKIVI